MSSVFQLCFAGGCQEVAMRCHSEYVHLGIFNEKKFCIARFVVVFDVSIMYEYVYLRFPFLVKPINSRVFVAKLLLNIAVAYFLN